MADSLMKIVISFIAGIFILYTLANFVTQFDNPFINPGLFSIFLGVLFVAFIIAIFKKLA